ncbi:thioredoxin family protein [Massilia sp. B-10]|nr:thioredoxin family protein [Massilia sp. B-10]
MASGHARYRFRPGGGARRPALSVLGAAWCPPCNRIKASVFERADFQALGSGFVALHIDGDSACAQQMAERFHVRSYPTLIVFRADGAEITRLPCELEGALFVELLGVALAASRTVTESLGAALSRERPLADDEWRLLSFYSWDTDEHQVLKSLDLAATLASLARACTLPEARAAAGMACLARGGHVRQGQDRPARPSGGWKKPCSMRPPCAQLDIVTNHAVDLVRFLTVPQSAARLHLTQTWSAALERLETDPTLTLADQLAALRTRVRMSRLGTPVAGLDQLARERVALAAHAVCGPAMRHQIINTAMRAVGCLSLLDEAEQLLLAELARSHAPFFFMHNLAAIAKKRGDPASAVGWYERAWDSATGPATRLQWGATYLQGLIDFAPHEAPRIERFASKMLDELGGMGDAACQRNRTQLERIDSKLSIWNGASVHAAALREAARAASGLHR